MYKQGEIVFVPVPFSDLSQRKQRPVLIISNNSYNQLTNDLLVAAITSQLKDLDYSVVINSDDLVKGSLKLTSSIRSDKIYSLSKTIILKKYGEVIPDILHKVIIKLNDVLNTNK
ncbi:type II toxin-antitoxin system PemK/MazF family toxin [Neobacillus sp. D3-1R]|uniref:type II toxin-antitoxin system PemK/MazF family toxin n=1 Tax=Neobacillus sp. D3-1R TaxID=3445778 RepID=UPI003F9F83F1